VPEEYWANAVFSLVPTLIVGLIFWFVMRAIFRADRTERSVFAKVEAEERARMGLPAAERGVVSAAVGSPATSTAPDASAAGAAPAVSASSASSAVPADPAATTRPE
jgi:Tfp pilus assembly protein PilX